MGYLTKKNDIFILDGIPFTGTAETICTAHPNGHPDGARLNCWCTDRDVLGDAYDKECAERGYDCYSNMRRAEFREGHLLAFEDLIY